MLIYKLKKIIKALRSDYAQYKLLKPCLDACDDRLSKKILITRLNYYSVFLSKYKRFFPWIKSPYFRFYKKINSLLNPIYTIEELESMSGKSLVVYGQGDDYNYTKSLLKRSDWRNSFRGIGHSIEGLKTIKNNEILIHASLVKNDDLYDFIRRKHPNVQIYKPKYLLWAITRNQYFDVFEPREDEYVIDCGAFDGKTEEMFYNWGGGHIKKIYAFELDPMNKTKCLAFYKEKKLEGLVEFFNVGTSNKNETILLDEGSIGSSASRIGEGSIEAQTVKLDDVVTGKVTFIKMDIEGAELDALHGATHIIQSQKPRLAICLYHKQSDMYDIPTYILSIVKDYKFVIRHYSSNPWETVLYAYV